MGARWRKADRPQARACRPYGLEIPLVHELRFGKEGADDDGVALAAPPAFAIMVEFASRIRPPRIPAMRRSLLALLLAAIPAASLPAQEYVWMEGEAPTRASVKFETGGWGHADFLSGGGWLHGSVEPQDLEKKIPAEGAVLSYDFEAKAAGDYEAWVRIGYEFVRSPFSWRLDGGAWKESKPDELTTDLMALQAWNEVAWLKLGGVDARSPVSTLSRSSSTANTRMQQRQEGAGPHPLRPRRDLSLQGRVAAERAVQARRERSKEIDKQAAGQVFDVKAGTGGERGVTPLGGAWQIARIDEQEIKDRTEPVQALPLPADSLHWKGIHVPGNRDDERPDLQYAHRFVYRTRLDVPAECKGAVVLPPLPLQRGHLVGHRQRRLLRRQQGALHRLGLRRDQGRSSRARSTKSSSPSKTRITPSPTAATRKIRRCGTCSTCRPTGSTTPAASAPRATPTCRSSSRCPGAGMFETPSFVVAGPAYTSDVFCIPSVKKKELGLEIGVTNPTAAPIAVKITNEARRSTAARRRRRSR